MSEKSSGIFFHVAFSLSEIRIWPSFLLNFIPKYIKPSAHSTIFVAGNRDLVFCRQRRKRISSIFVLKIVVSDKNLSYVFPALSKFSSSATKIFVLSYENLRPQLRKLHNCYITVFATWSISSMLALNMSLCLVMMIWSRIPWMKKMKEAP